MESLFQDAASRAERYLDSLAERSVVPTNEALSALEEFDETLPDTPSDPRETLELLDRVGSPATVATAGGRYFGYVIGGTLPVTLASHILSTAWDQNAGAQVACPGAEYLRQVAARWMVDLFGLPSGTQAFFVGGATVANLCGIIAGRDQVLRAAGWDAARDGLIGAPPINVVIGADAHSTVDKSLAIAGLGRERTIRVPADEQGRIDASHLPNCDGPTMVVLQAGNVNTGAFDPFEETIAWAKERDAWVHVDGAFGLWAAASPTRRHLTRGIAGADSWATDAHKWLNVPYDSGIILVRDARTLHRTMSANAGYLPDTLEPFHCTVQSSQRARAIDTWAALRSLGRHGVADLVDRCCRHAERFAVALSAAGHEVLNDVVINQVLVRFGDDDRTDEVMHRIQTSGECWCGPTVWQGRRAMRISVSSWATTEQDVERSIRAILHAAST